MSSSAHDAPQAPAEPTGSRSSAASASLGSDAAASEKGKAASPRWELLGAVAVAVAFLVAPIGRAGIWDPYELNVAELARRIAINVFHGASLVVDGGENAMPRLGDLGRGELPFDAVALGFRVFGMHEWAGRLPLAVLGLSGVLALYWLLARLADRRTALYGSLALSTMPLYFLHARTMLGDIATMASATAAFAGLAVATFDRGSSRAGGRSAALVLGAVGLFAGFMCRGLLLGVATPALGVGLSWAIAAGSERRRGERFGDIAGGVTLLLGVVAASVGVSALLSATPNQFSPIVGTAVAAQPKLPTYDFVILYLGHSLLPWSAFIPFAVGRLFRPASVSPSGAPDDALAEKQSMLRLSLLVGSAVAFGAYSLVAPRVGHVPFGAPALLAAIVAVALRDYDLGAPASRAVGVGVAVMTALFLRDYAMFPEKGLSPFGLSANFPESFKPLASSYLFWTSVVFVLVFFFTWLEDDDTGYFESSQYLAWPRALAGLWSGRLLLALGLVELGAIVLAPIFFIGLHLHARFVLAQSIPVRLVAINLYWVLPVVVLGGVWSVMAVRDSFRFVFARTGLKRGAATAALGVGIGAVFGFGYYPALAAQVSPKDVFEAYQRLHRGDEPLGLLGVTGRTAGYYSGSEAKSFADVPAAFAWLTSSDARRWLAVHSDDLTKLNSSFRGHSPRRENLPVLDAHSSQILLVSNVLLPGEKNQSPFASILFAAEPPIQHKVSANLQDQLESLGWEVRDNAGNLVDAVIPARTYQFRLFFKVLAPVSGSWEAFIHIDGFHRRFNGDHKLLDNKYPMHLWQTGDYVVDEHDFKLEPNFTPGSYTVYYGLFAGETRMKVKSGRQDDNRVEGGTLRVQ